MQSNMTAAILKTISFIIFFLAFILTIIIIGGLGSNSLFENTAAIASVGLCLWLWFTGFILYYFGHQIHLLGLIEKNTNHNKDIKNEIFLLRQYLIELNNNNNRNDKEQN